MSTLARSGEHVRALVRDPSRAAHLPPGVEVAVGDFADPASLDAAFAGVQRAFFVCLPEPAPARLVKHGNVVAAAQRAGVRHLAYLSFLNPAEGAGFPQGRWHADTEARIDAAQVPRTFLRPGLYQSSLLTSAGVRDGDHLLAPAGEGHTAPVAWQDVADVAATVLTTSGHIGRSYDLTGPELLDWHGIAAALGAAMGRTITYVPVTPEDFAERLERAGRPPSLVEGMLGLFADIRTGRLTTRTETIAALTGKSATTIAQTFERTARRPDRVS